MYNITGNFIIQYKPRVLCAGVFYLPGVKFYFLLNKVKMTDWKNNPQWI